MDTNNYNNNYYGRSNNNEQERIYEHYGSGPTREDSTYSYSYVNQNHQYSGGSNNGYDNSTPPTPDKKKRFQKGSLSRAIIKAIAVAAVFGVVAGGTFAGVISLLGVSTGTSNGSTVVYKSEDGGLIPSTNDGDTEAGNVESIVENTMPSMVAITNTTETQVQSFFGMYTETYDSCGSGIIIGQDDKQLYIVTNNHVIEDAVTLTVTFVDNESVEATVKGTDSSVDLAVIIVKLEDLSKSTLNKIKVAVMGDSDDLQLGESVIAIGNALGYGQTVTTGVVSALDRTVTVEDMTNTLLQTNAAINPGNSGGALLNMEGEVIGINSAKYSDTDVEGVGFAIPITDAQPIIENLISKDMIPESERGYLGIYGADVTEDISSVYNLPIGVHVSQLVSNGAAEKAGINAGDVIVNIAGTDVTTMQELQNVLQYYRAGEEVEVTVMTPEQGKYVEKTYTVKLQSNSSR